jgi:hypothetical protein
MSMLGMDSVGRELDVAWPFIKKGGFVSEWPHSRQLAET